MRPTLALMCVFAAVCAAAQTRSASEKPAPTAKSPAESTAPVHALPVRQVVLYKNGVGYFEHIGSVAGNQRVAIDFTSAQLNDVLQSLTILDEGGGRIAGVNYNSTTPLAEQLKSLSLGMDEDPTSTELFQALRGQRVEVTGGAAGSITGRLMNIESRSDKTPGGDGTNNTVTDRFYLTIVASSGAVRVVELTPALSVRPLDPTLQTQLDRYLELLSANHSTGLRHLTLDALGTGARQLHVSYISEVPVWKSTYRIVFPKSTEQAAILQGWAVVDNTVGADWDNVQLSLVAGAPQSFIQALSQPLYLRRPEIPISTTAMTTPQTHEAANMAQTVEVSEGVVSNQQLMNNQLAAPRAKAAAAPSAAYGVAGMQGTGSAAGVIGSVFGNGSGLGNGYGPGVGGNLGGGLRKIGGAGGGGTYETTSAVEEGDIATNAFDDFFQYTLAQPVTIHKNESAMVPILQEKLPAEHVTLWSPAEATPFRAIWLENTSKLTFDGGSFSIFENGAFAGEGLLDPIHPGEKRLVSYATDQAIRVRIAKEKSTSVLRHVHIWNQGIVRKRYASQSQQTYSVSNSADEPRVVVLEIPRQRNRSLAPEVKAAETAPDLYRFRVPVESHKSSTLLFADEGFSDVDWRIDPEGNQIEELQQLTKDAPSLAAQLKPIVTAQQTIQDLKTQLHDLEQKSTTLAADEARARDNLTALKGNDAARRFVDELNHAEDDLEATRKQSADLTEKKKIAVESLRQLLATLDTEWTEPTKPAP